MDETKFRRGEALEQEKKKRTVIRRRKKVVVPRTTKKTGGGHQEKPYKHDLGDSFVGQPSNIVFF